MARKLVTLLLVAALALMAIFLTEQPEPEQPADQRPETATPGAILTQATTRQYDANGKLQYLLKVDRAEQFFRFNNQGQPLKVNLGYTDLVKPKLTLYGDDSPDAWQLTADFGRTENSGNEIQLWGNVVAQKAIPTGGEYRITTTKLLVEPILQRASTEQRVKILAPEGEGDAVGMEIDMPNQTVTLKSQVNATYEAK